MIKLNTALSIYLTSLTDPFAAGTASDTIKLIGVIEKAVDVNFENEILDLGNMRGSSVANYSVKANTEYTVSTPENGFLVNENGDTLGYKSSAVNGKLTITPNQIRPNQSLGTYKANVKLTVKAI